MAALLDVINNRFIKSYYYSIIVFILLIIFSVASYYAYNWYYLPTKNKQNEFKDVANVNTRHTEIVIQMYTVDWCPHCKKALPEWKHFCNQYNNKVINNYVIHCAEDGIDCTDDTDPDVKYLVSKNKIESYPTVIMVKDNKRYDYDAKITKENLSNFVLSVTND
jgi:thiol-disulfide isomerase/thioredoxin